MNPEQQRAILAIALLAAFADGAKDEHEREQIRQIADSLGGPAGAPPLAGLYQEVLLGRIGAATAAASLGLPAHRQLAYELAVCVCDADGSQTEAERRFLAELRVLLHLDAAQASALAERADAIAEATADVVPVAAAFPAAATPDAARDAGLDRSILNHAILTGALELLPQSWASLAIIPLQVKMVYGIGKAHGVELDQGHIREFIAAAGVGLTSQYLEQFGRKLLGGLLGKVAGRTAGSIGRAATGMAFSFATTYALGQVARRYYAGGRQMSTDLLREAFQDLLGPAKEVQARYLPQIRRTASELDAAKVMALVRGA